MSKPQQSFDVIGQIGPLRRYAMSLTRNAGDAEDLVQDCLVRALERRDQFQAGRPLRGWLFSILHNTFIDRVRSRRSEALRNAEIGRLVEWRLPAAQEHAARLSEVRQAFLSLPEEQRAALHLVSIEGFSYDEAAASLGIPIGTLVSRVSRARAALRAMEAGQDSGNVVSLKARGGGDDAKA